MAKSSIRAANALVWLATEGNQINARDRDRIVTATMLRLLIRMEVMRRIGSLDGRAERKTCIILWYIGH
jgi:hypothetical protein